MGLISQCMLEQLHLHLVDVILRVKVEKDKVDLSVSVFVKGDVSCDATVRHIPYPGRHLKHPIQAFSMDCIATFVRVRVRDGT